MHQASLSGSAFVEMKKHEDFAEALRRARLEREARKEGEQEARERQQWQDRREANERSMAQVTRNQLSWHELREIEEAKRRDRIERRKQQLISSSTLPMGIAENMEKMSKRAVTPSSSSSTAIRGGEGSSTFKAEDPEKVRCCYSPVVHDEPLCMMNLCVHYHYYHHHHYHHFHHYY